MNLLLENIQNAKALLKKLDIPEDYRDFLQIKTLLSKKVGWVYWFCKLRFVSNVELSGLIEIYNYLEQNKNIVSKMGDITRFNNLEEIYDEVESLKLKKEVLSLYNEFPKAQKELINLNTDSTILKNLYDRKDHKDFLIKISKYKKRNDLINAIKDFINVNPNESIKNMIEICNKNNINIKIIKNDCLVIIAKSSKDIRVVAGDTSWCIKSQHMFYNYNPHSSICVQYVLYLPNEEVLNFRKIGVTIKSSNKNCFGAAHAKDDKIIYFDSLNDILNKYNIEWKSLLPKITLDQITKYDVKDLIHIGVKKEDILKNKKSYNSNDIKYFTTEEIDEWGLLNKTELNLNIVLKYSLDRIKKDNLLDRVKELSLGYLKYFYENLGLEGLKLYKKYLDKNPNKLDNDIIYNYPDSIKGKDVYYEIKNKNRRLDLYMSLYKEELKYIDILYNIDEYRKFFKEEIKKDPKNLIRDVKNIYILEALGLDFKKYEDIVISELCDREVYDYFKDKGMDMTNIKNKIYNKFANYGIDDHKYKIYKDYIDKKTLDKLKIKRVIYEIYRNINNIKYNKFNNSSYINKEFKECKNIIDIYGIESFLDFGNIASKIIILYFLNKKLSMLKNLKLEIDTENIIELDRFIAMICNKQIDSFDKKDCKKLYDFIMNQDLSKVGVYKYLKDDRTIEVKEMPIEFYLQLTLYNLYPEKFQKYIEMASKSKWNVEKSSYSMTGKIPTFGVKNDWMTTNRIYFFRRIISYYIDVDSKLELLLIVKSIVEGINPNLVELEKILNWINKNKFPKIIEYLKSILQTKTKNNKILKKYESFQYLKNFSNYKN